MLHQLAKQDTLTQRLAQLEKVVPEDASAQDPETKKVLDEKQDIKRQLAKVKLRPFHYSHQGSLAYIGSEKAIADLPFSHGNVSLCLAFLLRNQLINRFSFTVRHGWCRNLSVLAQCILKHSLLPA